MNLKIVDSPMGYGKSSWAIQTINQNVNTNYIYITPYLDEVQRVKSLCSSRDFREPLNIGDGKLEGLKWLLERKYQIASTHALFSHADDTVMRLIEFGNYTLILDEVMDVIKQIEIFDRDLKMCFKQKILIQDGMRILYNEDSGYLNNNIIGKFKEISLLAKHNRLVYIDDCLLLWLFPIDSFVSFDNVFILTYQFKHQIQRYYFDMYNIQYDFHSVYYSKEKHQYFISDYDDSQSDDFIKEVSPLVDVLDSKLNNVGDTDTALSSTWFSAGRNKENIMLLKKSLYNYLYNICKSKWNEALWTTFKNIEGKIKGRGYSKSFLFCNARATNDYRDRVYLAYCLNLFMHPFVDRFFKYNGITIDQEKWALSEMLQWIWRSAIRNGKKVKIYVPSSRMRRLLNKFLSC